MSTLRGRAKRVQVPILSACEPDALFRKRTHFSFLLRLFYLCPFCLTCEWIIMRRPWALGFSCHTDDSLTLLGLTSSPGLGTLFRVAGDASCGKCGEAQISQLAEIFFGAAGESPRHDDWIVLLCYNSTLEHNTVQSLCNIPF